MSEKPIKKTNKIISWFKGLSIGWKIVIIILAITVVFSIPYVLSDEYEKDQGKRQEQTSKIEESQNQEEQRVAIDEDFAEHYCQDAKFYGSVLKNYSLISIWDYNKYFGESGSYDKDGNAIYMLRWNGKNNITDEKATFVCYISGSDQDHAIIHYLGVDNTTIQGQHDFQGYTKDGRPEE